MTKPGPLVMIDGRVHVVIHLSQAESEAFTQCWRRRLMEASRKVGVSAIAAAAAVKEGT